MGRWSEGREKNEDFQPNLVTLLDSDYVLLSLCIYIITLLNIKTKNSFEQRYLRLLPVDERKI